MFIVIEIDGKNGYYLNAVYNGGRVGDAAGAERYDLRVVLGSTSCFEDVLLDDLDTLDWQVWSRADDQEELLRVRALAAVLEWARDEENYDVLSSFNLLPYAAMEVAPGCEYGIEFQDGPDKTSLDYGDWGPRRYATFKDAASFASATGRDFRIFVF